MEWDPRNPIGERIGISGAQEGSSAILEEELERSTK